MIQRDEELGDVHSYHNDGDKCPQTCKIAVSSLGDSDGGLAVFFIWRETTEAAAESDDDIRPHPSSFSSCLETSAGMELQVNARLPGFIMSTNTILTIVLVDISVIYNVFNSHLLSFVYIL